MGDSKFDAGDVVRHSDGCEYTVDGYAWGTLVRLSDGGPSHYSHLKLVRPARWRVGDVVYDPSGRFDDFALKTVHVQNWEAPDHNRSLGGSWTLKHRPGVEMWQPDKRDLLITQEQAKAVVEHFFGSRRTAAADALTEPNEYDQLCASNGVTPVDEYRPGIGTVRACWQCGVDVTGGPTACVPCATKPKVCPDCKGDGLVLLLETYVDCTTCGGAK